MIWVRMLVAAWRLVWPYVLTPWRSPLLRWRMETYGMVDARGDLLTAQDVTAVVFWRFLIRRRAALARFLAWSGSLR